MASGAVDANAVAPVPGEPVVGAALHRVDDVHLPAADQRPVDQTLRQAGLPGAGEPGEQQVRVQGRVVARWVRRRRRPRTGCPGRASARGEVERRQLRQRVVPGDQQPQRVRAGAGADLQEVVAGGGPQLRPVTGGPGTGPPRRAAGSPAPGRPGCGAAARCRPVPAAARPCPVTPESAQAWSQSSADQPEPVRARVGQPGVLRAGRRRTARSRCRRGRPAATGVSRVCRIRPALPRTSARVTPPYSRRVISQMLPGLPGAVRQPGGRQFRAGEPGGVERGVDPAGQQPFRRPRVGGEVLRRGGCRCGRTSTRRTPAGAGSPVRPGRRATR